MQKGAEKADGSAFAKIAEEQDGGQDAAKNGLFLRRLFEPRLSLLQNAAFPVGIGGNAQPRGGRTSASVSARCASR